MSPTGNKPYYTAEICENGHVTTPYIEQAPDKRQRFCSKCGARTVVNCAKCQQPLRGLGGYQQESMYVRPAYCSDCGAIHPWTGASIKAAQDLALQADLEEMDRTQLPQIIEDLVRDTPRRSVAAAQLRRILEKAKPWVNEGFRGILVDVIAEGARKMIWPSP